MSKPRLGSNNYLADTGIVHFLDVFKVETLLLLISDEVRVERLDSGFLAHFLILRFY